MLLVGGGCTASACSGINPEQLFDEQGVQRDIDGSRPDPVDDGGAFDPDGSWATNGDLEPLGDGDPAVPPAVDVPVDGGREPPTSDADNANETSLPDATSIDASSCADGDPCTIDATLADGACSHEPVACAPIDRCHVAGQCNPATGQCSAPVAREGTACPTEQGGRCRMDGVCTPTFLVVRVGDGLPTVTDASAPVRLERRFFDASAALVTGSATPIVLPQAAVGVNFPFSLNASAVGEGALSLAANGNYVTLAGYAVPPGTLNVKSTPNRVVARIDRNGTVDTSTVLTPALDGMTVRSATTVDGKQFWVSGGTGASMPGGIHLVGFGQSGGTPIMAFPAEIRVVQVTQNQLYAASTTNLLAIGAGVPTAPLQLTVPALPANGDPFAFAIFDDDASVPGADLAYVADGRTPKSGGGIQKWVRSKSGQVALAATFGGELQTGFRGLAALKRGGVITLLATTTELTENVLVSFVDDGTAHPVTPLATAGPNTAFRGVAFAP